MKTYHNTNHEEGETLANSSNQAMSQQEFIMQKFQSPFWGSACISPDYIAEHWFQNRYPITSIRRALTNLTDAGLLEKTDNMVMGSYGKMVHTWRLKQEVGQISMF